MFGSSTLGYAKQNLPTSFPALAFWLDTVNMIPDAVNGRIDDVNERTGKFIVTAGVGGPDLLASFKNNNLPGIFWSGNQFTVSPTVTYGNTITLFVVKNWNGFANVDGFPTFQTNSSGLLTLSDGTNTATQTGTAQVSGKQCTVAVTVSASGGNATFYVNGVKQNSTGTLTMNNTSFNTFGSTSGGASKYAEFCLWKSALTAGQIAALHKYAAGRWFDNT